MFLTSELQDTMVAVLRSAVGNSGEFSVLSAVSGGSINRCFKSRYRNQNFFIKVNSATRFPGMFRAESEGLRLMRGTKTFKVPEVIGWGESPTEQFIIMEWIEPGKTGPESQKESGLKLAEMHRCHSALFGLDHDNFMGSLPQRNAFTEKFSDFFIEHRLKPQVQIALDKNLINKDIKQEFEKLYAKIPTLFEEEKPSLVHGDLWSGNCMTSSNGEPVLIDPAVSYSNREVDIAMTRLFGGFDSDFYTSYNEVFPLNNDWEERIDLWNLYPLLIHLNLFGTAYLSNVKSSLRKYL